MGRKAQAVGSAFEAEIERVNAQLRGRGQADVHRVKAPMNIIGTLGKGVFKAVMAGTAHVDFEGVLAGGLSVAFDTKHVESGVSFPFAHIRDEQVRYLLERARFGACAFLLVRWEGESRRRSYVVPVDAQGRIAGYDHARSLRVLSNETRESVRFDELARHGWLAAPGETWADVVLRQLSLQRWPHQQEVNACYR